MIGRFKRMFILFLSLVLVLTAVNFPNELMVDASSLSTLYSNKIWERVAIEELGHGENTPFRKFMITDQDNDKNYRVMCGYSEGRGHPGDTYTRKVFDAKAWESAKDSALFGKNTGKIAKALVYFYDTVGVSNATEMQQATVQVYIWAVSMGRDLSKALKQFKASMKSLKNWKGTDIDNIVTLIKKQVVYGQVIVYSNKACNIGNDVEGSKLVHQPYYRWRAYSPEIAKTKATSTVELLPDEGAPVDLTLHLLKTAEGIPLPGTTFSVDLKLSNGEAFHKEITTDINGKASVSFQTTNVSNEENTPLSVTSTSGEKSYIKNWGQLSKKQQEKYSEQGYYASYAIAYKAAKAEADKKAESELQRYLADIKGTVTGIWTVTELSSPGYYATGPITKSVHIDNLEDPVNIKFDNTPKIARIKLFKKSSEVFNNQFSLKGAVYGIYSDSNCNNVVTSCITDEKGEGIFEGLVAEKNYYIREIKAPAGFSLDKKIYNIKVNDKTEIENPVVADGSIQVNEEPIKVSFAAIKQISDGQRIGFEQGVSLKLTPDFTLSDGSSYQLPNGGISVTDEKGVAKWKNLLEGTYVLEVEQGSEENPDAIKVGPYVVTVNHDMENDIIDGEKMQVFQGDAMIDVEKGGYISVKKQSCYLDKSGSQVYEEESGAVFHIVKEENYSSYQQAKDKQPYIDSTLVTDFSGFARSKKLDATEEGTVYILHQVSGKPFYKMSEDKKIIVKPDADIFYSNNLVNYQEAIHVNIHKSVIKRNYATGQLDDHPIPERDVTFAILDASKISDFTALKRAKTKEERKKYLSSSAHIANVTTDAGGNAHYEFPLNIQLPDGFILLQVDGLEEYEYLEPVLSTDLRNEYSKKEMYNENDKAVNYGFRLKKKTIDETDIYDLDAIDREPQKLAIAKVIKTMDSDGKKQIPEKNAVFSVFKFNENYIGQDTKIFQVIGNKLMCEDMVVGTAIMEDGNIKYFHTDADGEFYVPNLFRGEYIVYQLSGDKFHEKVPLGANNIFIIGNKDCVFEEERMKELLDGEFDKTRLKAEEQEIISKSQISLNNPLKPVRITLEKYSTHTNIKLNNAEYGLYRVTDEKRDGKVVVEKITTLLSGYVPKEEREKDGSVSLQIAEKYLGRDSASLEYGKYLLKETEAPFGYRITERFDDSEEGNVTYIEKKNEEYKELTGKGKEILFTIDSAHSTCNENGEIVYCNVKKEPEIFSFYNEQVRGKIGITKTGSVIADFREEEGFIEGKEPIIGAVYALYANEDIKDDSGKVFYKKGDEIDRKISNGSTTYFDMPEPYGEGVGRTQQLFMGKYEIKEIIAPKGYMVNQEPCKITLSCDGGAKRVNPIREQEDNVEQTYESGSVLTDRYYLIPGKELNNIFKQIGYENIKEVYFTHKQAPISSTRDVSAAKDGSVVLWQSGKSVFISTQTSNQEIYFNYDCNYMFANLTALSDIYFMNINTEYMSYASNMFFNCVNLQTLDISNFVTGNLTNSSRMFMGCEQLETIYTGDEPQKYKSMDNAIKNIIVCPLYETYVYYEPSAHSSEEEKSAMKFHVEDFSYYLQFEDGSMEEIALSNKDISNIDPVYPNEVRDDFPVTMTIADSGVKEIKEYIKNKNYECNKELKSILDGSMETPIKLQVQVKVVSIKDLDGKKLTEEYPKVMEDFHDNPVSLELKIRKLGVDYVEKLTNISGNLKERLNILAECDPTPSMDNTEGQNTLDKFVFEISTASSFSVGDTIVPGGIKIAKIQTIDQKTDDGGDVGIDLPNGTYCNGDILYTIKEVKGQSCYQLTDTQVKIPNMYFNNEPTDVDIESYEKKLKELNPASDVGFHVSYDTTDGRMTVTIVYANEPVEMSLKKNWDGEYLDASVPNSIKVEVRKTGSSQILQTITLKKEEGWKYTWGRNNLPIAGDNDVTHYDFCEVTEGLSSDFEEPVVWKDEINHLVILTNHLAQGSAKAIVQKIWEDDSVTEKQRPKNITVHLVANSSVLKKYIPDMINVNGEEIANDIELNEENNWAFETDANLPQTDAQGNKITWSWIEDPVEKYYCSNISTKEKISDGKRLYNTTLTNTYIPTTVTVTKKVKGSELNFHNTESVTFYFTIAGKTEDNLEFTKTSSVTFQRSMVEQMEDKEQYLEQVVQFNNIPFGTYTITETGEEALYECAEIMMKEGEGYAKGIIKE